MTPPNENELLARVLAKTCEYLDVPAVVGHETPFLDHLMRDYSALGLKVERSSNLVIVDTGRPGPAFIAHGDRNGAVVGKTSHYPYAAHADLDRSNSKPVHLNETVAAKIETRYRGAEVFAYEPASGGRIAYGQVEGAELDANGKIIFQISDLPELPEGTPLAFAGSLERHQRGFISGLLDNALTLAGLRIAAEFGLGGKIIATAEEESGRSARHFLDWAQAGGMAPTRELVVCDTSPFDDGAAALAGTVILRRRDASASFSADQVSRLERAANSVGAPIIFKDSFIDRENDARARNDETPKSMGRTELGAIAALSKGLYSGASLQLPTFDHQGGRPSTTPRAIMAFVRTVMAIGSFET